MIKKILFTALLIILISFNRISVIGATNGLNLWFYSIIPTLFPAMIIGNIIFNLVVSNIKHPRIIIVLIGIICGCPIAAMAADVIGTYNSNKIVPLANNLSLSFIINYICLTLYSNKYTLIISLCIYIPIIITIVIYWCFNKNCLSCDSTITNVKTNTSIITIVNEAINASLKGILNVGAYIILCSTFCEIIKYVVDNELIQLILCSLVEITNGCKIISISTLSISYKILLTALFCNFTGLCCILQAKSVLGSKLSIKKYIYDKLLLMLITLIISSFIIYVLL